MLGEELTWLRLVIHRDDREQRKAGHCETLPTSGQRWRFSRGSGNVCQFAGTWVTNLASPACLRSVHKCGFASLSTSSTPAVQPDVETKENEAVAPEFINRNPRNLELLGVARKERGWATVWPNREFWHRLRVVKTQHHVEAFVEHLNGQVVVSASTREWAIKKHLYSTRNVVACESVGRVLAQRCLEAGINFMVYQPTPWEASSDSIKRLQNAMTESGVMLREPRRVYE
uniref:Mitochondrial ribosomal protein L18 n=1 Tax=Rattus norvegicus TaxID=10116 RepID=A0A8I6AV53_RAT